MVWEKKPFFWVPIYPSFGVLLDQVQEGKKEEKKKKKKKARLKSFKRNKVRKLS